MRITQDLHDELVAHARDELPNECCGLLGARDGVVRRIWRAENERASPYGFKISELEQLRIFEEMDAAGLDYGGVYHSHTKSEPYPSQADLNLAVPGTPFVIVGMGTDPAVVRDYAIGSAGDVTEVPVEIVE